MADGAGLRVRRCTPNCTSPTSNTVYIFNGAQVIAEYDNGAAVGSPSREQIYLGGGLLARYVGSTITYYHRDHLSNRRSSNSSGTANGNFGTFPFGEAWYGGDFKWRFTSYERDTETGNDYAVMRSYVNRLGRFSSPDPVGGNVFNPQRLNRYAYVGGDPANLIDPQGLDWGDPDDDGVINRPPMLPMESDAVLNTIGSTNCVACQMPMWMILGDAIAWAVLQRGGDQWAAEFTANAAVDFYFYGGPAQVSVTGIARAHFAGIFQNEQNRIQNGVFDVFKIIFANQGLDPNKTYEVEFKYTAMTFNVRRTDCNGSCPVDENNLGGFWKPPNLIHEGWYRGYFFNTPHLINTDPISAHIDPFGPLNPLHFLIQIPSMLAPAGPSGTASCSINGCTVNGWH